jgi:hypothetical protein
MSDVAISVIPVPARALTFDVVVGDARGESRHRVTMTAEDAAAFAKLGADPSHCVEAAMRFLVDREPKEAILSWPPADRRPAAHGTGAMLEGRRHKVDNSLVH